MSLTPGRYPLTGVRTATTAPQEAFIARAREVLEADDRVLAAYLVGGFAVGIGDPFSDVDLQVLVAEESAGELAEGWTELIHRITPTVNVQAFPTLNPAAPRQPPNNGGGVCITPEWLNFDVVFRVAGSIDAHAIEGMVPLFDKAGYCRRSRRADPTAAATPSIRGNGVVLPLHAGQRRGGHRSRRACPGQQRRDHHARRRPGEALPG